MCPCDRANSPARSPRALASHIKLFCGPGRAWPYLLRAGPGPGLIIQFAGRARAGSSQLLRARAGPGPQIIFAGRAWALISGPCRTLGLPSPSSPHLHCRSTSASIFLSFSSPPHPSSLLFSPHILHPFLMTCLSYYLSGLYFLGYFSHFCGK